MPPHWVGEDIDKPRAHYQASTGKLIELMRGICVDANVGNKPMRYGPEHQTNNECAILILDTSAFSQQRQTCMRKVRPRVAR
jgi:hypothetical protein